MQLFVQGTHASIVGEVSVPTSKYHAHRALILASLAPSVSRIYGLSDAEHVRYTARVLRALGTTIERDGDAIVVRGGPYRPQRPSVSVGGSGSTLYFMIGLASLASAPVTLTGQKYFQRRPVGPLLDALCQMGVRLESNAGCPPIGVAPQRPRGGRVVIKGTLSQWISGLLLLAPFAQEHTTIEVDGELNERPYLQLTINMMRRFGLYAEHSPDWRRFDIAPNQEAQSATVTLPPDIGSAAFGLAAAALHPANVLFRGLTETSGARNDHPEAHFLDIVQEMGLPLGFDEREGAVRVRHDGVRLRGIRVDCREIPDMLPVLAALGTFAEGTTTFEHVAHVRLKESDRVTAMLQLNRMGGRLDQEDNRLVCRGVERLTGAALSSFNDHRVLMALAVAASRAEGRSTLTYPNAYRLSYPRFLDAMNAIGIPMSVGEVGVPIGVQEKRMRKAARPRGARAKVDPERAAATPITDWVWRWAKERPDVPAVVDVRAEGDRTWTWRTLTEQAERVAALLLKLGVQPGEPVAYQLPNWGEFVAITLAILRLGAVCCPLMPIFRQREVAFMLRRSRARVLFVPDYFRKRAYPREIATLGAEAATLEHVVVVAGEPGAVGLSAGDGRRWHDLGAATEQIAVDKTALDARRPGPTALAQLLFTSGTSGEPKGVLHRLDALTRAAAMEIAHLGLGCDDRIYIPSPLAHQTGFLYGMWLAFLLGAPQIVQAVWEPALGLRALRDGGGTFVQAATPFLADLVKAVQEGQPAPPALRIFVATGAAVPRGLAERATRILGTAVCGAWGTTETCLGTLAAPGDEPAKVWGADGRALHGVKIRITDDAGRALPPGEEGNFEVFSRCLFEGYLDRPDLTAAAYTPDGWYRSGDLAVLDESGYIRITGRVKDVINRGGEKIPVAEIEQLLYEHPALADVAIVAMPDERLGERACAFAVLTAGADFDFAALQRYLDERQVAMQYWPERLEVVAELPRTPSGKVQKYLLRERARAFGAGRQEEQVS